ncbi:UNVERIFIED_CONTAM: Expansin-A18 [Sesamum calycinum]|uniref:Expansin n=1 Tax=Sesamum calycinum TaxID=2727403 RepID=A0AAW2QYQ0_9LAMI
MAAALLHSCCLSFFLVLAVVVSRAAAGGYGPPVFQATQWQNAYATFYGDDTASATMGSPVATVTATNLCPPNWSEDTNNGGWCNPPRSHFDMAKPAFMKIAQWNGGIVPVMFRRVPCMRQGGIRFSFQGNGYWLLVYAMNVAGGGDIASMWVKGSKTGWISMSHNWGASYQAFATLGGQALSFKLTSYTSHETIIAYNVAPANWQVGMTYTANINFH